MKKMISFLLTLTMLLSLCACGVTNTPAVTEAPETTAETSAPEVTETAAAEEAEMPAEESMALYRTGKPWVCADLENVVTEDMPADLKHDFALAVNRDFYLNAKISDGYSTAGTVYDLNKVNAEDLAQLFLDGNDFSSHDSKLAKAYYDLMLAWDARNALGVAPLKTDTEKIEVIKSLDELISYYKECPVEKQLSSPFVAYMDTDLIEPDQYIAWVGSSELFLRDSGEYSKLTELGTLYRDAYHDLVVAILPKLGYSGEQAQQMWEDAIRLEEMMAPYIFTSEDSQKPDYMSKINNHMTRDEMIALQGRMPVVEYLEDSCGYGRQDNWLVMEPRYFEAMQTIFTDENLPLIKSWIICHAAKTYSKLLDRDCYDLYLTANTAITGAGARPDEVVAADEATTALPWQTAHMYCDRYFTQQDKDSIQSIIDDAIETYQKMLMAEDFISEETKAYAVKKLDSLRIRNLYPDDWSAYTDSELNFKSPSEGGSLLEAIEAIGRSHYRRIQEKVKHPVDHELWSDGITPTTVNCFYNSSDNSINILAAFCRGGIYSADMSHEEICAKMGVVIAHEITHAFDSTGSQFDATGAFKNWWTDEDRALFNEKNDKLAAYYSNMTVWDGANVNGDIKTGEACADMGAIKCMLMLAAEEENFDYDTFFRSYADLWAIKGKMYFIQLVRKDAHPAGYLRINSVLQQFDEFLDFYGITEGDNMYLAPADRVAIW